MLKIPGMTAADLVRSGAVPGLDLVEPHIRARIDIEGEHFCRSFF
jgi:tRNA uridine 5-carboxymethylaminomethyl modification enzyme